MGVGAIFISTLAVTELPAPQSPPQGQAETLAATLQTIVSFVVLGSIIIREPSPSAWSNRLSNSDAISVSARWPVHPVLLLRTQCPLAHRLALTNMDIAHEQRARLAALGPPYARGDHTAQQPSNPAPGRGASDGRSRPNWADRARDEAAGSCEARQPRP